MVEKCVGGGHVKGVEEAVERAVVLVEVRGVDVVDSTGALFKNWKDVGFEVEDE